MWLLPVFSPVSRLALRTFYRLSVTGRAVSRHGPAVLVANHPNSLLDPAVVVAAAGRPVRFLAKAPLFTDRLVGWLVRGAGAIPVYRRIDPDAEMARNQDTFRAAHLALEGGAAVGVFPEGVSHSAPALEPLKTGAARIALGAAARDGRAFPIHPVGLIFRDKGRFRSEALAVVGEPVAWDDLSDRGESDPEAVRELTRRLDEGLRAVTVNLERWEDAPVVEAAQAIYAEEFGLQLTPAERVRALREVSEGLMRLRGRGAGEAPLAREVRRHARLLEALDLTPHTLMQPAPGDAAAWTLRQLAWFALVGPLGAAGAVALYPPYRLTGWVVDRLRLPPDLQATYKVLIGALALLLWLVLAGAAAARWVGPYALAVPPLLALLGLVALAVRDRWRDAEGAARRFVVRGRRAALLESLRRQQRALADALARLREAVPT